MNVTFILLYSYVCDFNNLWCTYSRTYFEHWDSFETALHCTLSVPAIHILPYLYNDCAKKTLSGNENLTARTAYYYTHGGAFRE